MGGGEPASLPSASGPPSPEPAIGEYVGHQPANRSLTSLDR